MKDNDIMHSIGAALQACAARVSTSTTQRPLVTKPAPVPREPQATPHMHLTARQLEVLRLLCEGLPNKLICRRLNIATGTVKVHISCIFRELGVASRLQAVVESKRRGLLDRTAGGAGAMTSDSGPAQQTAIANRITDNSAGRGSLAAA